MSQLSLPPQQTPVRLPRCRLHRSLRRCRSPLQGSQHRHQPRGRRDQKAKQHRGRPLPTQTPWSWWKLAGKAVLRLAAEANVASRLPGRTSSSDSNNSMDRLAAGAGPNPVGQPPTRRGGSGHRGTAGHPRPALAATGGSTMAARRTTVRNGKEHRARQVGRSGLLRAGRGARKERRVPLLCRLPSATSVGVPMPRTPISFRRPLSAKSTMRASCGRSAGFLRSRFASRKARSTRSSTSAAQSQR
mmetsp:Transcript_75698/g.225671  ORF Transcript_75698/g.225671 Transcript_75698/m.225671 type:complete len:245 (+) Transcript_75698:505-1239(+)